MSVIVTAAKISVALGAVSAVSYSMNLSKPNYPQVAQRALKIRQAAEYLGMSLKTLLENYSHHHPDYLSGARDAFDRAPKDRQRKVATDREQTQPNVLRIADRSR